MKRERTRQIFVLALPIIGGMISQNVMNLVDIGMVGRLGKEALAAVGIASFATFMSQAFLTGLSAGVQAIAARRMGEGKQERAAIGLNGGLLLAFLIGIGISSVLFFLSPHLFGYLNDDPQVVKLGTSYWRIRLFAVAAVGMNFSFRGYFNGVNQSGLYLRTLIVMHVCNLLLNYTFIFGKFGFPAYGSDGAALGTTIATWIGTITYFFLAKRRASHRGFLHGLPDAKGLRTMLRLSIPNGVQQLFFAGGLTTLFWIIGKIGTAEVAAGTVLVNIMLVAILPGIGFGLAATTLVGQALGRHNAADAKLWAYDVLKVGAVAMGLLGLPMLLFPSSILAIFVSDIPTREVARLPLMIFGASVSVEAVRLILLNALLGAGDNQRVMMVSILNQWVFMLPLAYLFGVHLGYGLVAVWSMMILHNIVGALIFLVHWHRGSWSKIQV